MTDTVVRPQQTAEATATRRRDRTWPLTAADLGTVATAALVMLAVTVAAGLAITGPLGGSALARADAEVNRWFASMRTPTWNELTDWGSSFSDTITIVGLLVVLIPALRYVTGRWNASTFLAGAVAVETFVFVVAALLVGRDRPPVEQLDMSPPTASFPSGHTGAAFAFYLGLILLVFYWTTHRPTRALSVVVFGAVPLIVAMSRLYRGMHFPSDVLFGAVIGSASAALFASLVLAKREETSQ